MDQKNAIFLTILIFILHHSFSFFRWLHMLVSNKVVPLRIKRNVAPFHWLIVHFTDFNRMNYFRLIPNCSVKNVSFYFLFENIKVSFYRKWLAKCLGCYYNLNEERFMLEYTFVAHLLLLLRLRGWILSLSTGFCTWLMTVRQWVKAVSRVPGFGWKSPNWSVGVCVDVMWHLLEALV